MSIIYTTKSWVDGRTILHYESGTIRDIQAQLERSPEMQRLRETERKLKERKAAFEAVMQYKEYCEMADRPLSEAGFKLWCYENELDPVYLCSLPCTSEFLARFASTPSDTPSDQA